MRNFLKDRWEQRSTFFFIKLLLSCLAWYTAIYWVADSRYNRELARLEARVTNIVTRLEGNNWRKAIEDIPTLQRTLVPHEPLFFDIISVYKSLNPAYDAYDEQIVKELSKMLVAHKEELYNLDLKRVVIDILKKEDIDFFYIYDNRIKGYQFINLSECNLNNSDLSYAALNQIMYSKANLKNTKFFKSKMNYSYFINSDLSNADFYESDLSYSFFYQVKLDYTNFSFSSLRYSYLLGSDFSKSLNLDKANLKLALYNSQEIKNEDVKLDYLSDKYKTLYCEYKKLDQCFPIEFSIVSTSKTIFPVDFDPKAHGMIDLSDFIDYIKIQEGNSK